MKLKLTGDKETEKALLALGKKVAKKTVKKSVRVGSKNTLAVGRALAKSRVGGNMGKMLARFMAVRPYKKQRSGSFAERVFIRAADVFIGYAQGASSSLATRKTSGTRYYIPNAIEFGHVKQNGGFVPAISFMRAAEEQTNVISKRLIENDLKKRIHEEAKKGGID